LFSDSHTSASQSAHYGELAKVAAGNADSIRILLGPEHRFKDINEVVLTVDPFAVLKLNVKAKQ